MKKILSVILVAVLALSMCAVFASCDQPEEGGETFKIGIICLHDEKSTYDLNFLNAVEDAKKALGLDDSQVIIKKNIPESNACYEAAAELVDDGCSIVFANSFGHEDFMIKAAKEFTDVQFCHATGVKAHNEGLSNYHNAFAHIYQGRYLAGVAAGMKLNEMIAAGQFTAEEAKMGYVGAFTYAEVISGYTSFYLGAKSVCPTVTMEVQFTGSWYDAVEERNAALALINNGCKLISQHADSMGAPSACEENNIPNVSYNGSTVADCPNTFIVSSRIDWSPYFQYIINQVKAGEAIDVDWCGGITEGSVALTAVNEQAAAEGTAAAIEAVKAELVAGTRNVYDVAADNFITVGGEKLTSYLVEGKEVVSEGYFHESEIMSAPYFDIRIDGITLLNEKY